MATGSKTEESKPSLELPTELPYDFLKKITNDFSKDLKISGSPFGTLYKVIFTLNIFHSLILIKFGKSILIEGVSTGLNRESIQILAK
jgi:hypothetical protein